MTLTNRRNGIIGSLLKGVGVLVGLLAGCATGFTDDTTTLPEGFAIPPEIPRIPLQAERFRLGTRPGTAESSTA